MKYSVVLLMTWMVTQAAIARFDSVVITLARPNGPSSIAPYPGGKVVANSITVSSLIQFAFRTNDVDLTHVPSWVSKDLFDIVAVPDHPLSREETALAVRELLQSRFMLDFHKAVRSVSHYKLTLTGKDLKLRFATARRDAQTGGVSYSSGRMIGRDVSMTDVVEFLSQKFGVLVIDRTLLLDRYDFNLEWKPEQADIASRSAVNSLDAAMRAQLGLSLVSEELTQDVLVVDRIQKPPPSN